MTISFQSFLFATQKTLKSARGAYFFRRPAVFLLPVYVLLLIALRHLDLLSVPGPHHPVHWAGQRVVLKGVVAQHPDPRLDANVFVLEAETLRPLTNEGASEVSVQGKIQIWAKGVPFLLARPGDRLSVLGKIQIPGGRPTPGAFDYQQFLATRGVHAVIYTSARTLRNVGSSGRFPWLRRGWDLKTRLIQLYDRQLTSEAAAVLSGLTVGLRPRFHPDLKKMFVESGTMHVLVASGSNVAFLLGLWILTLRVLCRAKNFFAFLTGLPLIWFYAFVVGNDPPIFRAALMATVAMAAYFFQRFDHPFHAWSLAGWVALLLNPSDLFDVGFQMSFITVAGLLYWLPFLEDASERVPSYLRWPGRLAWTTLTAQIWIWPVMAGAFLMWRPIGLVANMVVVPLAAFGLVAGSALGLGAGLASLGIPWALEIMSMGTQTYLDLLIGAVRFFSTHFSWTLWSGGLSAVEIFFYYALCLLAPFARNRAIRFTFIGTGVLFGFFLFLPSLQRALAPPSLSALWLDHGRGVSFILADQKKNAWIFSSSPSDSDESFERRLFPFLIKLDFNPKAFFHSRAAEIPEARVDLMKSAFPRLKIFSMEETNPKRPLWDQPGLRVASLPGSKAQSARGNYYVETRAGQFLIGETWLTRTQKDLSEKDLQNVLAIQGRFYRNWRWLWSWQNMRPKVVVETRAPWSESVPPDFPSKPEFLIAQEEGFIEREFSKGVILSEAKDLNE